MKKIITVAAIAAASFAIVINGNAGKANAGVIKNAVACADDNYANDTTPKKHKRKKDTTGRDTMALVYNAAEPTISR